MPIFHSFFKEDYYLGYISNLMFLRISPVLSQPSSSPSEMSLWDLNPFVISPLLFWGMVGTRTLQTLQTGMVNYTTALTSPLSLMKLIKPHITERTFLANSVWGASSQCSLSFWIRRVSYDLQYLLSLSPSQCQKSNSSSNSYIRIYNIKPI